MQSQVDTFIAKIAQAGISISNGSDEYMKIEKEEKKHFSSSVTKLIAEYQQEFGPSEKSEDQSMWQCFKGLLTDFLNLILRLLSPQQRISSDLSKQTSIFYKTTQNLADICGKVADQPPNLKR